MADEAGVPPQASAARLWLLGLVPLALMAAIVTAFAVLGAPGLGDRRGPPVEDLVVDKIALHPGLIDITVRNDGPDAVGVRQVIVNDGYAHFTSTYDRIGRLAADTLKVEYPWIEGEAYEITLLTSTGGTIAAAIPIAVESPDAGASFYGLMALLGTYVGVVPVLLGMLWLPLLRRSSASVIRVLMAFTIGLLLFLVVDALLEGTDVAGQGSQAFGGSLLVYLGAIVGYLTLSGVDVYMRSRGEKAEGKAASGLYLALLVAIGIGLHNLGEGLAIGAAYAAGALALGAVLVIGFAIHNTTEGLAVVAPVARNRPSLPRLVSLGLFAGAPAILGAWIGASAFNGSVVAFLLGVGAGAIAQVIVQLAPFIRDDTGRHLYPKSAAGLVAGIGVLYLTSLLITT
ncbi:MAG: zinc transporter, family [Gaiellales bacterium]|jgi:zinc transporter ZupT|nr:zinc transporter, family [Gaiellales bacterium]